MDAITFKNNILQKNNRIKIPTPVVDALSLKEGDSIHIILDTVKECIIIKKNDKPHD